MKEVKCNDEKEVLCNYVFKIKLKIKIK